MAKTITAAKPRTTGVVFRAPLGTVLPTDATTALPATYKKLGKLSDDGFTNNYERSSEDIREMGGAIVLTVQTEVNDTFSFKLLDALDADVLAAVYGASNVSGEIDGNDGITVLANSDEPEEGVWVLDTIMRDGTLQRIIIPDGKISEMGETVYRRNEAVGYDITLTALYDETTGCTHKTIIKAV